MRVKVKQSPYRSVKKGAVGEVIGRKHEGTKNEIWKVETTEIRRVKHIPTKFTQAWFFYINELEVIDG